jgi:hypothetical protein
MDILVYRDIERYGIECWNCGTVTYFDYAEFPALATMCWRCDEIINGDL